MEEILSNLLEIVFETNIEQYKQQKFAIINEAFMEILCSFLSLLAVKEKWKGRVSDLIKKIDVSIEGSYWNYSVVSNVLYIFFN